jgi:hypothetical protein
MQAATAPDLNTATAAGAPAPRLGLAAGSAAEAPGREPSTTSITVTLRIDVRGEGTPAAVTGLLESVRALAGPAAVTVTHSAAPAPNGRAPNGRAPDGRAPDGWAPDGWAPNGRALPDSRPAPCGEMLRDGSHPHDGTLSGEGPSRPAAPGGEIGRGEPDGREVPVDRPSAWPRPRLVREAEPPSAVPVLRVYLDSRLVLRAGVPIRLTRREYDLLTFLCQHPRRVFSRRQLMRQVWGHEMVGGERTVDVHVRRLRVKLDDAGPVISTVRGVGYRLDDVTSVAIIGDPR